MKKFTIPFLLAAVLLILPNFAKGQSYTATIVQQITPGGPHGNLDVSIYIESNNSTSFVLGSSTFFVGLNSNGLDISSTTLSNEGIFSSVPANFYSQSQRVFHNSLSNTVGIQINPNIQNQSKLTSTPKVSYNSADLVGTLRIPITDPSLNSNANWVSTSVYEIIPDPNSSNKVVTRLVSGNLVIPATFALPVELISFTATTEGEGTTLLNWATASERDNSHFDVEYSTNGTEWVVAGIVEGNGTTTARQDYNFTHYNNNSGTTYYRLRQVDYNGQFEYSPIRSVSYAGVGTLTSVNIHPNPTVDRAEISVKGYNGRFNATFFNTTGQQVNVFQGNGSQVIVPVSNMNSGIYIVRITSLAGEVIGTQRLVIGR